MSAEQPSSEWARAWADLVEGGDPRVLRRLHQGRAYHRAGRVSAVRVTSGAASVRVQGDRATPFAVEVTVPVLEDDAWAAVVEALASQVRHSARLLAGHAPDSLDAELDAVGVRVFPAREELTVSCDCGDETWPCNHAAALWEALADRIDEDPFVLLQMRGRGRERLLSELAAARRKRAQGDADLGVPLASMKAAGWSSARATLEGVSVGPAPVPPTPAPSLRVLGNPPGWQGGVDAWALFHPLAVAAAEWVSEVEQG